MNFTSVLKGKNVTGRILSRFSRDDFYKVGYTAISIYYRIESIPEGKFSMTRIEKTNDLPFFGTRSLKEIFSSCPSYKLEFILDSLEVRHCNANELTEHLAMIRCIDE